MRIAFLCSGGGGNLRFVASAIREGWIGDAQICAVLSDRECAADAFARTQGLFAEVMDFSATGQPAVLKRLLALDPQVIVTTVHRILTPAFVGAFAGRIVNLHYSLLPAFAVEIGDGPVRTAIEHGVKFVGVTVHQVDERVDMGRPIIQAVTAMPHAPKLEEVMNVLFRSGCIGLLNAIASFSPDSYPWTWSENPQASTTQAGQVVHFNPAVVIHPSLEQEQGWDFLSR